MTKTNNDRITRLLTLVMTVCFCVGALLAVYPAARTIMSARQEAKDVQTYCSMVADFPSERLEDMIDSAWDYNLNHKQNIIVDPFDKDADPSESQAYRNQLNVGPDGIMATVIIPKIHVSLPVRHGTGEDAMSQGLGHLQGTSLPVGGPGTHAAMAGHSGLTGRSYLKDLDKLEEGDLFYIMIGSQMLAYQVDQIKTVLPSQTEDLAILPGQDLVTLITCTPRFVNSHRLLVRGHSVLYKDPQEPLQAVDDSIRHARLLALGAGLAAAALLALAAVFMIRRFRKK